MSKEEAVSIIQAQVAPYRSYTYEELRLMMEAEEVNAELIGPSGAEYAIEIQAFWDNHPNGNIRILGSIDESPHMPMFWRIPILRWLPIYSTNIFESFIKAPDGSFVGEDKEGDI